MACLVDLCTNESYARGFCSKHYNRLRVNGTVEDGPLARAAMSERFFRHVDVKGDDDCWEWKAKSRINGYGVISCGGRRGKKMLAHRASWEIHKGPIPKKPTQYHGTVVMHMCDNRLCVNPNHLKLGTQADNIKDMDSKGRRVSNPVVGNLHHMTALTERQVKNIYQMSGKRSDIAVLFSCKEDVVKSIKTARTWAHVTSGLSLGLPGKPTHTGLPDNDVRSIYLSGEKSKVLAKMYNCHICTIQKIRGDRSRQNVTQNLTRG